MEVEEELEALFLSPLQLPESLRRGECPCESGPLGGSVLPPTPSDSVNTELRSLSELFDLCTGFLRVPTA